MPSGVMQSAKLGGQSAAGDSVFLDVTNNGTATEYFARCGTEPLVLVQQFVNGT